MFSYSEILKDAYHLTKRFRLLWLFGMFLLGGFNASYAYVRGLLPEFDWSHADAVAMLQYLRMHPGSLAVAGLSIVGLMAISLVVINWSKILLLLVGKSCIEHKGYDLAKEARQSRFLLWPVIQVSILTYLFLLAAVVVLAAPMLVEERLFQAILWALGAAIFFLVVFTISALNIFTTMFMVLLKLPTRRALNAATDFFAVNLGSLLGLVAILLVVYFTGAALGLGFLGVVKLLVRFGQVFLSHAGGLQFSAVFTIIKTLGALLLWVWLGALNAFLNISLLLFFLKKITPVKGEEEKVTSQPTPAPAVP